MHAMLFYSFVNNGTLYSQQMIPGTPYNTRYKACAYSVIAQPDTASVDTPLISCLEEICSLFVDLQVLRAPPQLKTSSHCFSVVSLPLVSSLWIVHSYCCTCIASCTSEKSAVLRNLSKHTCTRMIVSTS